jgi:hypothetical protein
VYKGKYSKVGNDLEKVYKYFGIRNILDRYSNQQSNNLIVRNKKKENEDHKRKLQNVNQKVFENQYFNYLIIFYIFYKSR